MGGSGRDVSPFVGGSRLFFFFFVVPDGGGKCVRKPMKVFRSKNLTLTPKKINRPPGPNNTPPSSKLCAPRLV